jgi:anti-sigma B factor antagonist
VAADLDVRVDARNGVTRIALAGELDMSTAPILEPYLPLDGSIDGDGVTAVILDLRDLSFVHSTGLHAFLRARNAADEAGHRFYLIGAARTVRRVFELTEMDFLLDEPEAFRVLDLFSGSEATSLEAADVHPRG